MNVMASKAEVTSFALELSKDLGMRYVAPALPVEISLNNGGGVIPVANTNAPTTTEPSLESLAGVFENKKFK